MCIGPLDGLKQVEIPVNVLLMPGGPTVGELGNVGVRRVSTGGLFSNIALGAVVEAAQVLRATGQLPPNAPRLSRDHVHRAFTR